MSSSSAIIPIHASASRFRILLMSRNGFCKNSSKVFALGPSFGALISSSQLLSAAAARVVDNFQPVSSRILSDGPKRESSARALLATKRSCATSARLVLPSMRCCSIVLAAAQANSSKRLEAMSRQPLLWVRFAFANACAFACSPSSEPIDSDHKPTSLQSILTSTTGAC